jgi:hypothetical protein
LARDDAELLGGRNHTRAIELHMVRHVEHLKAILYAHVFQELELFDGGHIEIVDPIAPQVVEGDWKGSIVKLQLL